MEIKWSISINKQKVAKFSRYIKFHFNMMNQVIHVIYSPIISQIAGIYNLKALNSRDPFVNELSSSEPS